MQGKFFLLAGCCLAVLGSGCTQLQTLNRIKPEDVSPFLEHQELLVPQKATFPFHYFYLKKDAGRYDKVVIAPVNVKYLRDNKMWSKLDQQMASRLGTDIEELAKYTRRSFTDAFATASGPEKLQVVSSATGDKTLIVEVALVMIVPTKAELTILGTAANLLLPGIGVITGRAAAGSVTMECMIRDAKTGEIIAMFANTERDQQAVLNLAGMTWYTSAKNNIRKQAEQTAKVFSGQDYSYTRRMLIKVVEF